jgi:hypothetical protein
MVADSHLPNDSKSKGVAWVTQPARRRHANFVILTSDFITLRFNAWFFCVSRTSVAND